MGDHPTHPLVVLQLNLGAATRPTPKAKSPTTSVDQSSGDGEGNVSKHVRRHLISEYLKQSIFSPDPAFIALQDNFTKPDIDSICDAMKERPGTSGATYEWIPFDRQKKAALMYDTSVMIFDEDCRIEEDDFFRGDESRDMKAQKLFKRLDGGLFQHESSKEFIVAVSYHGRKKDCPNTVKREYIAGIRLILSSLN